MEETKKEEIKRSPIQIIDLSLVHLDFRKRTTSLKQTEVSIDSIKLTVSIDELDENTLSSLCDVAVFVDEENSDFQISLSYLVVAQVSDKSMRENLEMFARIGAMFNVLVHAREAIASLTARAFGKAVILPTLNITEFGHTIKINVLEKPRDSNTIPANRENPAAEEDK